MFTRIVEVRFKPGKAQELSSVMSDQILPLLKKQPGFMDAITLMSKEDPSRLLALSFWQSEADAERYQREQFQNVGQLVGQFLQSPPKVQTFDVETSTVHKIGKGKAA